MDNSDSEQLKIKAIPEMSCKEPVYSILRLPVDLPPSIDTTDLVGLYGYTEEDFSAVWSPSISVLGEEDYSDSESGCLVGDDVTESGDIYISFLPSAETIAALRDWVIRILPCGVDSGDSDSSSSSGGEGSVSLGGAVRFSNRPITSLSIPTFIPRSGGSRRPDESSSSEGGDCCKHQFTVKAAGTGITIFDGHNPSSESAGVFNYHLVASRSIALADDGTYYVYLIDTSAAGGSCSIYALNHQFNSALIPSLLLAVVVKTDAELTVTQSSYQDYPVVNAEEPLSGVNTTFSYTLSYTNYVLTVAYTVSASVVKNNSYIQSDNGSGGTALPIANDGQPHHLYVYSQRLTTASYTDPQVSSAIAFTLPSPAPEWYSDLLYFRYTVTASNQSFQIISRMSVPFILTFAYLPLNAAVQQVNN